MILGIFYLVMIFLLVYWIETDALNFSRVLISSKRDSENLEDWLKKFNWAPQNRTNSQSDIPQYKFYSEVVELLLSLARKFGGTYQDSLLFLRQGLQADRQFEKKIKEAVLGTWLQMALMVMLTWGFIGGSLAVVEVKVNITYLELIAFWQLSGMMILPICLRTMRIKYFGDIGKLWKTLYVLRSLSRVPLARSDIMSLSEVGLILAIKQKTLLPLVEKLKYTCQKNLQEGGSYEQDVHDLMEELRFQEKWHFELFEKRLIVLKLGLMSIFFLPSYLAFIFCLLDDLLTLM